MVGFISMMISVTNSFAAFLQSDKPECVTEVTA